MVIVMYGSDILRICCFTVGIVLMFPFLMKEYMFVAGYLLATIAIA